jgi:hypothetical protein
MKDQLLCILVFIVVLIIIKIQSRYRDSYTFISAREVSIPALAFDWDWSNVSESDAILWSNRYGKKIARGCYASHIFNQHMSKWCGCCYLVSVVQIIQDKVNIALGINSNMDMAQPYIKIDMQIVMDEYNNYRRKNHPDWNACLGGNPNILIQAMKDKHIPLVLSSHDGFAWYGFPRDIGEDCTSSFYLKDDPVVIENIVEKVQEYIMKLGPVVMGINANCMSDEELIKRKGVINENVFGPRNHAISVIGWKTIGTRKYWIGRNSWGENEAPENKPEEMTCVKTNENTCAISKKKWKGDPNNPGYIYIPFDYGPIKGTPSPWFGCCPTILEVD